MPILKTKIEFSEKDIADLIANSYGLKSVKVSIIVQENERDSSLKTYKFVAEGEQATPLILPKNG
jgi:hypothetical protein